MQALACPNEVAWIKHAAGYLTVARSAAIPVAVLIGRCLDGCILWSVAILPKDCATTEEVAMKSQLASSSGGG